jgi:TM2 domain-containing membrane protein YozV
MGTWAPQKPTKYCPSCGVVIDARASVCPACGTRQPGTAMAVPGDVSEKRLVPALLLGFFLGVFGAHRFYAGKIFTGVLMLCTLGGLGIWWLIDMIMLVVGGFRDSQGKPITLWV